MLKPEGPSKGRTRSYATDDFYTNVASRCIVLKRLAPLCRVTHTLTFSQCVVHTPHTHSILCISPENIKRSLHVRKNATARPSLPIGHFGRFVRSAQWMKIAGVKCTHTHTDTLHIYTHGMHSLAAATSTSACRAHRMHRLHSSGQPFVVVVGFTRPVYVIKCS